MQNLTNQLALITIVTIISGCNLIWPTPVSYLDNKPKKGTKENPITLDCCGEKDIIITYLGASGFLLKKGNFSVLTAPFFSNPATDQMGLHINPDVGRIDKGVEGVPLETVKLILVGHAHYDHLMDVPNISKRVKSLSGKTPKIYGSVTMRNLLLNKKRMKREQAKKREDVLNPNDIVSINNKAAVTWNKGEWVCVNNDGEITDCKKGGIAFRFMPIQSEHAPHFAGYKYAAGKKDSTSDNVWTAWDWKEGQTFAYLMDFLKPDGSVDLRIHFQDATSNSPNGFIPLMREEPQIPVDLAIMCVAGFSNVTDYPDSTVLNLKPKHVILSHWEHFFEALPSDPKDLKVVQGTDLDKFIFRLNGVLPKNSWRLPAPGSIFRFIDAKKRYLKNNDLENRENKGTPLSKLSKGTPFPF